MKTAKKFDCVKMKDDARPRRADAFCGLSERRRLDLYRRSHEALVRRQQELRSRAANRPA